MKHVCKGEHLLKGPRFHNWGLSSFGSSSNQLSYTLEPLNYQSLKKMKKRTSFFASGIWVLECSVYMDFIILQECNMVRTRGKDNEVHAVLHSCFLLLHYCSRLDRCSPEFWISLIPPPQLPNHPIHWDHLLCLQRKSFCEASYHCLKTQTS